MKFKTNVYIVLDSSLEEKDSFENTLGYYKYNIEKELDLNGNNCISLVVQTNPNSSLKNLLSGKEIKENLIKVSNACDEIFITKENCKLIKRYLAKTLWINTNEIILSGNLENIETFLYNNSGFSQAKITLDIDYSGLDNIFLKELKKFSNTVIYEHLYIATLENNVTVRVRDYFESMDYVEEIARHIKSLNFSPIEQVMYVYDLVRKRVYNLEPSDKPAYVSREFTYVVNGEYIVCSGYTRLFNVILSKLGINTLDYTIKRKDSYISHMRSALFLNDKKYNIKGVYFFDPTWDSRKSDDINNNYLKFYKYFALTKKEMETISNDKYEDIILGKFDKNFIKNLTNTVQNYGPQMINYATKNTVNTLSKLIFKKSLMPSFNCLDEEKTKYWPELFKQQIVFNFNNFKRDLYKMYKYLNSPIDGKTLFDVFLRVKKQEFYEDPNINNVESSSLASTAANSQWHIDKQNLTNADKKRMLIAAIFEESYQLSKESIYKSALKQLDDSDINLDMQRINLTRTLRNAYITKSKK